MVARRKVLQELLSDLKKGVPNALKGYATYGTWLGEMHDECYPPGLTTGSSPILGAAEGCMYGIFLSAALGPAAFLAVPIGAIVRGLQAGYGYEKIKLQNQKKEETFWIISGE